MASDILDIFEARRGIIAVSGAGGKKTTLYRLVAAHPGRIAVTSTVHTPRYRQRMNAFEVVCEETDLIARVTEAADIHKRVAYAHPGQKPARLRGVSPELVLAIHNHLKLDATFVKSDGARLRWLKAPEHKRPVLPCGTNVLICLLSVRAIGKPVSDEVAHHAPEVARVMGISLGETITAVHLARLLAANYSNLSGTGETKLIPVLNMVESKDDLKLGRLASERAMELSGGLDRVVLTSMIQEDPVVEIVS